MSIGFHAEGPRRRTYKVMPSGSHPGTWVASYGTPKDYGRMVGHLYPDVREAMRACVQHAGRPLEFVQVEYRYMRS